MQSMSEMAKKAKKNGSKEERALAAPTAGSQAQQAASVPPKAPTKTPPKARTKSADERRRDRIDGIKKTVYPAALGVMAGFACYLVPDTISLLPWHFVFLVVILVTYTIQKFTYPLLQIDATAFQAKDWLYVEFMAIDLWLVTWTLLLN
ncbi:Uncharacterised protein [uncultured archaeon]|nr:Uncharacterised protein [uncultured archaeon]